MGQRLESLTLDILELLLTIPNSGNKHETLEQISVKLDLLKILLRLAKDTQSMKVDEYLELQVSVQEIGRMLGGWIRAVKQNLPKEGKI